MVTKAARGQTVPTDRPLQYTDIDAPGRKALGGIMNKWGKAKTNMEQSRSTVFHAHAAAEGRAQAATTPEQSAVAARSIKKQTHAATRFDLVTPHLRDANVSLGSAASARTQLAQGSTKRTSADDSASPLRDSGAGWYFEHRKALNKTAETHDIPQAHVVAASAVMSPLNSPENERNAIESLAHLHSKNPELTFDAKSRKSLGIKSKSAKFSDLTSEQASMVGSPQIRKGITGVHPDVLRGVASGGPNTNIAKAVDVLRGNVKPEEAINPRSSAKVWSYHNATKNATPGGAVHEEYLTRAQTALHEIPGQQTMDLFGLRHSTEGILDPKGHTAEDTWMNAVSSGQPLKGVEGGRHLISPAKVVGSEKSFTDAPKTHEGVSVHPASKESIRHAWNNQATINSAKALSKGTDVQVPSVLSQETSWTEGRRVAGKDPEYNKARTGSIKPPSETKIKKKGQSQAGMLRGKGREGKVDWGNY